MYKTDTKRNSKSYFPLSNIYINNLETEPPLRHFTGQNTEATISKCGSSVLYSIRMKMGIIRSVLLQAFIKQNCVSLSAWYFKDLFRFNPFKTYFDTSIRTVLIKTIIKTGKDACTLQYNGFSLYLGSHESHHASFQTY